MLSWRVCGCENDPSHEPMDQLLLRLCTATAQADKEIRTMGERVSESEGDSFGQKTSTKQNAQAPLPLPKRMHKHIRSKAGGHTLISPAQCRKNAGVGGSLLSARMQQWCACVCVCVCVSEETRTITRSSRVTTFKIKKKGKMVNEQSMCVLS